MAFRRVSGTIPAVFRKILVANRGEIAVRIIRTLREMGIGSVAVYSDADRTALHVRHADEAVNIGPAPSRDSYLDIDRVLDACRRTAAEAVHPGYGFLSENGDFAEACASAKITFIGPGPAAMRAMGNKTTARQTVQRAGVAVVPGSCAGSDAELARAAHEIGWPVLLKAAAGGGGKGMRLVQTAEGFADALQRARSEAKNAFGDDTLYLERALTRPRHVEVQVLCDSQGTRLHLFERDCSIQRRHQKVIEESPSPAVDAELVAKMGEVALRVARAVDYVSAGTVEFLLDTDGSFYFLEMNTRLQVEHPVTELRLGVDLVREQVRVAAGQPLGLRQEQLEPRGHAIECRICAEDPTLDFLPSPGTIHSLQTPGGPGVRDDSGAYAGATITSHYDPLVSKLCVCAPDRPQAVARMSRALAEYVLSGIQTNLGFHQRVMRQPDFVAGRYDTGFIEQHADELLRADDLRAMSDALAVGAAVAVAERHAPGRSQGRGSSSISAWRRSGRHPWGSV
ncbi:MAG: acetyl-CoA carboxylase biotin carboxylase subunit [Proteobacteria bacterium]|nr:acetyl-CoA carboxylase biotin carboxylase subunit [Pseudomonadota bacterium]